MSLEKPSESGYINPFDLTRSLSRFDPASPVNFPPPETANSTVPGPQSSSLADPFRISPKRIDVAFLPVLVRPESLLDRTVILTDVLRATTTIIHALFNGCQQVLPQPTIEAARACHAQIADSVMGGERGGKIIAGFHQGNSPLEYTRDRIGGKSLVLATTNGTVAMEHCRTAKRILIGAMINLGAIAEQLTEHDRVTVVCSGTDGHITSEDVIFAGAMVERILASTIPVISGKDNSTTEFTSAPQVHHEHLSDLAAIALNHWQSTSRAIAQGAKLSQFFRLARGGINLVKIGLDADIEFAAQIDAVPIVPELDVADWSIRVPTSPTIVG